MQIEIRDTEAPEETQAILDGLREFNRPFAEPQRRELNIFVKDPASGELQGGLVGFTSWQWLYVRLLWVSEKHRSQGVGRRLMLAAEQEALRRGCVGVWLDTFSFQALDFYKRLGYAQFGILDNFPPGHQRFFLQRRL